MFNILFLLARNCWFMFSDTQMYMNDSAGMQFLAVFCNTSVMFYFAFSELCFVLHWYLVGYTYYV